MIRLDTMLSFGLRLDLLGYVLLMLAGLLVLPVFL
jgi:hypothetical protein